MLLSRLLIRKAMGNKQITEQEKLFCELFVNGTAPYAGNAVKCYSEVFKDEGINASHRAKVFMSQSHIKDYLSELEEMSAEKAIWMKHYLTQNLMKIIDETSTEQFYDRNGTALSVAPLRSVAVTAAKALMDMYPVKEAQVNKLNIEGSNGEGGITFNVIVPDSKPIDDPTE